MENFSSDHKDFVVRVNRNINLSQTANLGWSGESQTNNITGEGRARVERVQNNDEGTRPISPDICSSIYKETDANHMPLKQRSPISTHRQNQIKKHTNDLTVQASVKREQPIHRPHQFQPVRNLSRESIDNDANDDDKGRSLKSNLNAIHVNEKQLTKNTDRKTKRSKRSTDHVTENEHVNVEPWRKTHRHRTSNTMPHEAITTKPAPSDQFPTEAAFLPPNPALPEPRSKARKTTVENEYITAQGHVTVRHPSKNHQHLHVVPSPRKNKAEPTEKIRQHLNVHRHVTVHPAGNDPHSVFFLSDDSEDEYFLAPMPHIERLARQAVSIASHEQVLEYPAHNESPSPPSNEYTISRTRETHSDEIDQPRVAQVLQHELRSSPGHQSEVVNRTKEYPTDAHDVAVLNVPNNNDPLISENNTNIIEESKENLQKRSIDEKPSIMKKVRTKNMRSNVHTNKVEVKFFQIFCPDQSYQLNDDSLFQAIVCTRNNLIQARRSPSTVYSSGQSQRRSVTKKKTIM